MLSMLRINTRPSLHECSQSRHCACSWRAGRDRRQREEQGDCREGMCHSSSCSPGSKPVKTKDAKSARWAGYAAGPTCCDFVAIEMVFYQRTAMDLSWEKLLGRLIKVQKLRGSRSFGKAMCLTRCGAAHSTPLQDGQARVLPAGIRGGRAASGRDSQLCHSFPTGGPAALGTVSPCKERGCTRQL